MLPEPRYVVTELKGFSINHSAGGHTQGLSCHVIDRHCNYRLLATYRTEDRPRIGRVGVRKKADEHAARLNAR